MLGLFYDKQAKELKTQARTNKTKDQERAQVA